MDTLTTFQLFLFVAFVFCLIFGAFLTFIGMEESPVIFGFGFFLILTAIITIPAIGTADNEKNVNEYRTKCDTAGGYINQIEKDWSSQLDCIIDGKVVQL